MMGPSNLSEISFELSPFNMCWRHVSAILWAFFLVCFVFFLYMIEILGFTDPVAKLV